MNKNVKVLRKAIQLKSKSKTRVFTNRQGWKTIGEKRIYFRSNWEVAYAKYLQFLKEKKLILEWEHEPETFWFENIKRGVRSYLPDFKVTQCDGSYHYVEVKGYMDAKSKTKIKRFKKYYPKEHLVVIEALWFKEMKTKLQIMDARANVD